MIPHLEMLRELVKSLIQNAPVEAWSVQGMGMLRMYPAGRTFRINIWDPELAVPNVSMIHDHPWGLQSIVLAGRLVNTRYLLGTLGGLPYSWAHIQTGEGGGIRTEAHETTLSPQQIETYNEGGVYSQEPYEIHETGFIAGTITINRRIISAGDPDQARVFWPAGRGWVDAEPHPATQRQVDRAINRAMKWWPTHV